VFPPDNTIDTSSSFSALISVLVNVLLIVLLVQLLAVVPLMLTLSQFASLMRLTVIVAPVLIVPLTEALIAEDGV
jgi:hypothetical protein